ncbi:hypothetical protein CC1G_02160 [Coprinopsis cinerea okayama7|uniref:Uncharacterized protein n=1 Tax=Coprinopsis cinerea (strain Okayama-7 / 130 / ATCC MYA-4618 / FGSC 9003) TaxID=240176 RepID=A8NKE3_COPC7|nr:hypothetical protein CC1G_02160 [Coprinopsis cinerea okayama7\|eukprot:XP_001834424.1 hypothetical protein CC1G_02160 [Coprinopsis cinerea okayama7\
MPGPREAPNHLTTDPPQSTATHESPMIIMKNCIVGGFALVSAGNVNLSTTPLPPLSPPGNDHLQGHHWPQDPLRFGVGGAGYGHYGWGSGEYERLMEKGTVGVGRKHSLNTVMNNPFFGMRVDYGHCGAHLDGTSRGDHGTGFRGDPGTGFGGDPGTSARGDLGTSNRGDSGMVPQGANIEPGCNLPRLGGM